MTQLGTNSTSASKANYHIRRTEFGDCRYARDMRRYVATTGKSVRGSRPFRRNTLHRLSEDEINLLRHFGIASITDLQGDHAFDHGLKVNIDSDFTLTSGLVRTYVEAASEAGYAGACDRVRPNPIRSQSLSMGSTLAALETVVG